MVGAPNDKAGGRGGEDHSHRKVGGMNQETPHTPAQAGRKEDPLPLALFIIVLPRPRVLRPSLSENRAGECAMGVAM